MTKETLAAIVTAVTKEAETVKSYELVAAGGGDLPPFQAGAHVDLHLPNGMIRSYSLTNNQNERHRYLIAVHRDHAGRGGSHFVHDSLHVGESVTISAPRNNFPLREDASHSVLIGGGIGITPLVAMATRLVELGQPFDLHYVARTRAHAAFLDRLEQLKGSSGVNISVLFDQETKTRLDIGKIVNTTAPEAHLYCCGPGPMLDTFKQACSGRHAEFVHLEHFGAAEPLVKDGGFEVELAQSGLCLTVHPGRSILDALLEAGIDVAFSCEEGVCGTCETAVLSGVPDHRDQYLSAEEREENKTMMICCSGSRSPRLVLDL
jgi:vanillate O-demethylase ferredoxin subunit